MTTYEALMSERYGPTPDQIEGRRRLDECVREADEVENGFGEWVVRSGIRVWRAA